MKPEFLDNLETIAQRVTVIGDSVFVVPRLFRGDSAMAVIGFRLAGHHHGLFVSCRIHRQQGTPKTN